MAHTAPAWTSIFARYNSGTYNNQYMVLDYKLVSSSRGKAQLPANTLNIIEQIPGAVHAGDVTDFLNRPDAAFWPSYNVPYFQDIFNASGYPAMAAEDPQFSYDNCARANIFRRGTPCLSVLLRAYL